MKAKEFGPMEEVIPTVHVCRIWFRSFGIRLRQYNSEGDHYFDCKELGFDRELIKNPILKDAQAIALQRVEERLTLYTKDLELISLAARQAEYKLDS